MDRRLLFEHWGDSMSHVEIHDYQEAWVLEFRNLGSALREVLGDVATRIDHIGSTSVPGLAAKPIIDIQISVSELEPMHLYRPQIEQLGFAWRENNTERTKRYFREQVGRRRTHIHVRKAGSWHEQYALLFRDYVRVHSDARDQYEQVKRELAGRFPDDMPGYTEAKDSIFWDIMRRADRWAAATGWEPGSSDA
jgi:GrpB-like predicted nucleotidyltransferase (UPF0157 family)